MLKQNHDVTTGLGRLGKLTDDLATFSFKPGEFDLGAWSCGTSACAVGWCCTFDWAINQGLIFKGLAPFYKGNSGYEAAAAFFGVTLREIEHLFAPSWSAPRMKDPIAQSEHMRAFLTKKGYYL